MKKSVPWIIAAVVLVLAVFIGFSQRGRIVSFFYGVSSNAASADGRPERAALAMEKELELNPGDLALRFRLVDAFLAIDNYARAEYHLSRGITEHPGEFELYRRLSELYIKQDKLLDAVSLLDGVSNPRVIQELGEQRPASPKPDYPSGEYEELISLTFESEETIYINTEGEVPSVKTDMYTGPIALGSGVTALQGVCVSGSGLASAWWTGVYMLKNIKEPVVFQDAEIERLVRAAIEYPSGPVYSDMLWDIKELVSEENTAYITLNDLKWLTSLEKLVLYGNSPECDISVLPELISLKSLTLSNFNIDVIGLEPISLCPALEYLDVSMNRIASVSPIASLAALKHLDLNENSIIDVSPLGSLTALEYLDLSKNAIENVSPLAPLIELRVLLLNENRISGLYGLQGMAALTKLDLSYNNLTKLDLDYDSQRGAAGMGGLTSLTHLYASNNQLATMEALAPLSKIQVLNVSSNSLTGLEGIQRLTSMSELDVSNNQIASLSGIEPCVSLVSLGLNHNDIDAIAPLISIPGLKTLNVEYNRLTTLKAVLEFPAIELVNAFGNTITDPIDMFSGKSYTVNRS